MRGSAVTGPDVATRARLFDVVSLLLTYPDAELVAAQTELRCAAEGLPEVESFLDWLTSTPVIDVQRHYVQVFDMRRASGLYLTYYLHGDTRKRGIALLTLKQRYKAHGLHLADGQLPDLLPIVLEFASLVGPGDGEAPLRQHRRGIELLRTALAEANSPYRSLLDAITAALPPLTDADREAIAALAQDGPPLETVGIGPDDELSQIGLAPYGETCTESHS